MMPAPEEKPFDPGIRIRRDNERKVGAFVLVPAGWIRVAKETGGRHAVTTALVVWYRRAITRNTTFSVSNSAASIFGLDRKQKASGLRSLAQAGLVRVEQSKGKSPLVSIIWHGE